MGKPAVRTSNFEASDTLVREAHGVILSFEHIWGNADHRRGTFVLDPEV